MPKNMKMMFSQSKRGSMMAHPGGSVDTAPKDKTEKLRPGVRMPGRAGMPTMRMPVVGEHVGYVQHPSKLFTGKHPDGHRRGNMMGHMEQDLNKKRG